MCKILGAIAIKDKHKINKLITINRSLLGLEPDGFSFVSDQKIIRSLNYKFEAIRKEKFFLIHTRTATEGAINSNNVHCYQIGDWVFSHNGMVSGEYSSKYNKQGYLIKNATEEKTTDSYRFFKSLARKKITHQSIIKAVDKKSLWGIGVLINRATGRMIIFSKNKTAYLYTDEAKTALVFSSYEPRLSKGDKKVGGYGLIFDRQKPSMYDCQTELNNQILELDTDSGEVVKLTPIPQEYAKYNQYDYKKRTYNKHGYSNRTKETGVNDYLSEYPYDNPTYLEDPDDVLENIN